MGISNHQVLDFAKYLDELKVKTIIRHVLLPNINADKANLTKLRQFIGLIILWVSTFSPYHKAGTIKWDKLGVKYELVISPNQRRNCAEKILKENYNYMK